MPFDLQPLLKAELIELRPLQSEDFNDLYAVAKDPLMWEQHPNKDRYKEEVFKEFFSEALESGGVLLQLILKTGTLSDHLDFTDTTKKKAKLKSAGHF